MLLLVEFIAVFLLGTLVTEGTGYLWHRSVCHAGTMKFVLKDVLRRRHHDHHEHKYPDSAVRRTTYLSSCDISFRVLGLILVAAIIGLVALAWIQLQTGLTLLAAVALHSVLGLKLHSLYHLPDKQIRSLLICRSHLVERVMFWLRDFHDVHHVVNANYSLVLPVFDLIGGTYISPGALASLRREALFPRFDPRLNSSCEERLL